MCPPDTETCLTPPVFYNILWKNSRQTEGALSPVCIPVPAKRNTGRLKTWKAMYRFRGLAVDNVGDDSVCRNTWLVGITVEKVAVPDAKRIGGRFLVNVAPGAVEHYFTVVENTARLKRDGEAANDYAQENHLISFHNLFSVKNAAAFSFIDNVRVHYVGGKSANQYRGAVPQRGLVVETTLVERTPHALLVNVVLVGGKKHGAEIEFPSGLVINNKRPNN